MGRFMLGIVLLFLLAATAYAQCARPTLHGLYKPWPTSSTIYYDITTIDSSLRNQFSYAFSNWNSANDANGSKVTFAPSDASHPASIHVDQSPPSGQTAPMATYPQYPSGTIVSADIHVNMNATIPGTSTPVFNPNSAGWGTVFGKMNAHEIGHTIGLADINPTVVPGESLMNQGCGQNDMNSCIAVAVSTCDNGAVGGGYSPDPPPCGGAECIIL
jgi:hypothetical protein